MADKKFNYKVNLVPLNLKNQEQTAFRDALNAIPYLLYEVEQLGTGEKIVINKPGGKRNFGKLSRNDFMVFIYNPQEESLWLISHDEIQNDLQAKYTMNQCATIECIKALYRVCCGQEPDEVIAQYDLSDTCGMTVETLLKVYKWIWGQEDCNYPDGEGRWFSMAPLLEHFGISKENIEM